MLLSPGVLWGISACNLLPSFCSMELGQGWGEGPLPAEQQQRIWPVYVLGQSHFWWFSEKAFNSFSWCNNWSPNSAWDAARQFQWAWIKQHAIPPFSCDNTSLELSCTWDQGEVGYLWLVCSNSGEMGASQKTLFKDNLPGGIFLLNPCHLESGFYSLQHTQSS